MSKVPLPQSRIPSAPVPVRSQAGLGKDASRRPPPRESFRPRQSIAPGMVGTVAHTEQWDLGELNEEAEAY